MKKIFRMMMALSIAAFTFTACEDVPEPYNNPYDGRKPVEPEVVIEGTGSGTADDPWNVAALITACNGLAADAFLNDGAEVYVKGIVTETTEVSAQFGNATYYISDDAKGSNRFYVYRGKLLDGASVTAETDLEVGDEVTVCGKVKNFKGNTLEFDQGNYLVALKKGEGGGGETPATPGTVEKPLTVPEALAYIDGLGADKQSPTGYVKGKIAAITEVDTGQYGNATYLISDDGTENVPTLQIYRGYSFGGEKFKSANEIKVGDEVIITGKLINFRGNTKQFAQGSSIYSLNGKVAGGGSTEGEAKGDGTLANPFNPVAAINFASKLASGAKSDNDVYIKGKISKIANNGTFTGGGTFGNATFYISEDGTENNEFYVFRTLYLGNVKYTGGTDIKVGDEVIICGKVMNYMGNTPETSANESYVYSLNGQTAGGETPTPTPTGEVKTVTVAEFNAAPESNDVWYQLTGTVKNLKDGDIYGNFDLEDATGSVYVYGLLSEKGGAKKLFQELVAAKGIKEGCTLTLIGNRGSYNDKIEVVNAYFVSIEGGGTPGGGGETPGGETGGNGGVLEGNTLTVVYGDLGISAIDKPIKLVDGTTLTFAKEDGKNNPIYHESTKIVRMYAHNSVTVNAGSKKIAKVVFNYDTYQGTAYCGNDALYGEAGGNKLAPAKDDKTVTFNNVNASTLKVVNDFETNSGGTQFRCTGLVVTYAE